MEHRNDGQTNKLKEGQTHSFTEMLKNDNFSNRLYYFYNSITEQQSSLQTDHQTDKQTNQ